MKKIIFLVLLCDILLIGLVGCTQTEIVGIPKGYINKEEHYDEDGFQDYTHYAKYVYPFKEVISDNKEYKVVTNEEIENIKGYFDNFYNCMKAENRLDEYDFDTNVINEGDYVKIITKEGQPINGDSTYRKYDNYSIYFFDTKTLTLYYIHSNI